MWQIVSWPVRHMAVTPCQTRLADPRPTTHVAVAGSDIKMSDHLEVLGVTLDSSMTLDTQVTATVRACNFHLQSLQQLRSSLPRDVAQSVACAIIGSGLDYCNSLYYGMSNTNFQALQNAAARTVCQASRRQHHSPTVWSSLLSFVRTVDSFTSFRSRVKTYRVGQIK